MMADDNLNDTPSGEAVSNGPVSDDTGKVHIAAEAPRYERDQAEAADSPTQTTPPLFQMASMPDLSEHSSSDDAQADEDGQSQEEFTTVYDIIDAMDATLDEGKTVLFTPGVVKVNREALLSQMTELKKMLPVQLERASALMREAERRLDAARTQANAIVSAAQSRAADMVKEANEQAQFLAGQENVVAIAQGKAHDILEDAQNRADRLSQGADRYSMSMMEGLDQQLEKLQHDVHAGMTVLQERQKQSSEQRNHDDV
ncbi:cell division protein [Bifidobacterium psychraerophilum]|jgi:vacuolar-type H+-ATPase subunit H|uniref:cell division protein n=1 Tax=Bifidobacterium psychraerophilum TaxID=218140 RepID=UPI0023EFB5F2|nr:cell division protein [Bifidobacterium psychraerophilum]MCI1805302.1 cell division protein [Bifidobacterium psychraerophilum]MCI2177476.1 cell division protein [Bifidobacterium psychraerophilum]MCI2182815.1 cell division protein [Bifidobacterium psychraerophilum]